MVLIAHSCSQLPACPTTLYLHSYAHRYKYRVRYHYGYGAMQNFDGMHVDSTNPDFTIDETEYE